MQKRTKITIGAITVIVAGLLAATQLSGNTEDLQGRFSLNKEEFLQDNNVSNKIEVNQSLKGSSGKEEF